MSKIVSVIIPIYNVEAYLAKCLDSVINQTYRNLEIICVNDCSPDNCASIVEDYARRDSRIKLVNREENGGLSAARNSGLDVATGEYIYFIDSDDWIDLDYIEKMVDAAISNNAKVVINTNIMSHRGSEAFVYQLNDTYENIENKFIDSKEASCRIVWNAWVHLWKKAFLDEHSFRFPEGYFCEDMFFQAVTYPYLDKLYVIRNSSYHYFQREGSIMHNKEMGVEFWHKAKVDIFRKIFSFYKKRNLLENQNLRLMNSTLFLPEMDKITKRNLLSYVRDYFSEIKEYIGNSITVYSRLEREFFYDVLNNFEKAVATNYVAKAAFEQLHRKMVNRAKK